jgi:nucleoside 2-deoxyribosyltransferase
MGALMTPYINAGNLITIFAIALLPFPLAALAQSTDNEISHPCIYLASPLGFSDAGRRFLKEVLIPEISARGYSVVEPFSLTDPKKITAIQAMPPGSGRVTAWQHLNAEIGETNRTALDKCPIVVAVLDGADVDSGTAAAIGYAFGKQKKIFGYRSDFRLSGDDEGGKVNLQVEYFIHASGGLLSRPRPSLSPLYHSPNQNFSGL